MSKSTDKETLDGIWDLDPEPTLGDLFAAAMRILRLQIRVAVPAKVLEYNSATQKAKIELQNIPVVTDSSNPITGERQVKPIIIPSCPVAFPRGGNSYITLPITAGDTGQLIICDRSLETWLSAGVPVDPQAGHTHNLADGVFYPGLHPDTTPITPPTDATGITVEAPTISLGSLATDFVVKGTSLATAAQTISTVLAAVPAAADPATTATLANANKTAIIGLLAAIQANISTKTKTI